MHDLVVEAFNPARNQVVATGRWNGATGYKVSYAHDKLALVQPLEGGFVALQIVTLHVTPPTR
jgi:hypothetical protein